MIDLNRAPIRSEGLTLFADATDSGVWYFLPDRPRIQRTPEGTPALVLLKYRGGLSGEGPQGGGLLNLTVQLDVSASALHRASTLLRQMQPGGFPRLVPLPAERVTCELTLWTGSGDGHTTVSREPAVEFPHVASFEVPLSMQAAMMFQAALQSNASPAAVVYQLDFAARRPTLPAKITIDWRRAIQFFTERGAIDEPLLSGQIASSVQRLVEDGTIRIEIELPPTTGLEPFEGVQQKAVDETVALVIKELFEPGPAMVDAAPAVAAAAGIDPQSTQRGSLASQTYRRRLSARELRTTTYDLGQPREDTRKAFISAALNTMLDGADIASLIVETEEPPTRTS